MAVRTSYGALLRFSSRRVSEQYVSSVISGKHYQSINVADHSHGRNNRIGTAKTK